MKWRRPVKVTDHISRAGEYEEGSVGKVGSLRLNVRELQEPVLYAAALTPKPLEKAGHLMLDGQRRDESIRVGQYAVTRAADQGKEEGDGKGEPEVASGPREEWPKAAAEPTGEEEEHVEEVVQPLVWKRRRLERDGQPVCRQGGTTVMACEPSCGVGGEGAVSPRGRQEGSAHGEEGQGALPLVMVPFEAVTEEDQRARKKQAALAASQEARSVAVEVMCAAPSRLGEVELTRESTSGAAQSEGEASDGTHPYVLDWPHVTKGSNLASQEARLEWLKNCLPPNVMEGYKEWGASSTMGLGVQSALLEVIAAVQTERLIVKQTQQLKVWKRSCKSAEETAEVGKTKQQELAAEVAALTADLTQA